MNRSYGIGGLLNVPKPAFSPAFGSCQWVWFGVSCIVFPLDYREHAPGPRGAGFRRNIALPMRQADILDLSGAGANRKLVEGPLVCASFSNCARGWNDQT